MSILGWLNPKNWVKSAIVSSLTNTVNETVTLENGKALVANAVNYGVQLSASNISDRRLSSIARGLKSAGDALTKLGEAVDPDGEGGREVTPNEVDGLLSAALDGFGLVFDAQEMAAIRGRIIAYIKNKVEEM